MAEPVDVGAVAHVRAQHRALEAQVYHADHAHLHAWITIGLLAFLVGSQAGNAFHFEGFVWLISVICVG